MLKTLTNIKSLIPVDLNRLSKQFFPTFLFFSLLFIPVYSSNRDNASLIKDSPKEVIDQVWQIVFRDYLDTTGDFNPKDWIKLRKKLLSYTRFLDPKEFKEMRIDTSGELTGIGIQISIDEATKNIIVISPIEGTPAFKLGIQAKDVITAVDSTYTKGLSIDKVVKLIRGKPGTKVKVTIIRDGKELQFDIVRARIKISSVTKRLNKTSSGNKVGYIRLKQFSSNSSRDMRLAINSFEKSLAAVSYTHLRAHET